MPAQGYGCSAPSGRKSLRRCSVPVPRSRARRNRFKILDREVPIVLEVKLFARARDLAGGRESVPLTGPRPATVGELRRRLAEQYPPLAGLLERCAIAVDQ